MQEPDRGQQKKKKIVLRILLGSRENPEEKTEQTSTKLNITG